MNKLTKAVFISFLVLVFILFATGCPNDIQKVNEERQIVDAPQRDEKIYSSATIDDHFDDRSVVVILDNLTSGVNKKHDESFFGTFEKEYVYDSTTITSDTSKIDKETFRQIFRIRLPQERAGKENVLAAIRELEKIEGIRYAGPSYYMVPAKAPDDQWYTFGSQWALNGILDGNIQAEDAWDITTGSYNVKVGIIDSGIANHPDLNANLIDGRDFTDINTLPFGTHISGTNSVDPDGHGTHVAGIVGAVGNNRYNNGTNYNFNSGISGVCWDVSLVPMKTDEDTSSGDLADAITWAKNNNIKILNFSSSFYDEAPEVWQALYNYRNEILFITAAGNGTLNRGTGRWDSVGKENTQWDPVFPASYTSDLWYTNPVTNTTAFYSGLPNLISVGSIDHMGTISSFSNYSYQYVDIFAPGGSLDSYTPWDILSTYPLAKCGPSPWACPAPNYHHDYGYHFMPGTSMAAPMVTGVAALMLSVNSTQSPSLIKQRILQNVDTFPIVCTSGGRLNAYKAVLAAKGYKPPPYTIGIDLNLGAGGDAIGSITINADGTYNIHSFGYEVLMKPYYELDPAGTVEEDIWFYSANSWSLTHYLTKNNMAPITIPCTIVTPAMNIGTQLPNIYEVDFEITVGGSSGATVTDIFDVREVDDFNFGWFPVTLRETN